MHCISQPIVMYCTALQYTVIQYAACIAVLCWNPTLCSAAYRNYKKVHYQLNIQKDFCLNRLMQFNKLKQNICFALQRSSYLSSYISAYLYDIYIISLELSFILGWYWCLGLIWGIIWKLPYNNLYISGADMQKEVVMGDLDVSDWHGVWYEIAK